MSNSCTFSRSYLSCLINYRNYGLILTKPCLDRTVKRKSIWYMRIMLYNIYSQKRNNNLFGAIQKIFNRTSDLQFGLNHGNQTSCQSTLIGPSNQKCKSGFWKSKEKLIDISISQRERTTLTKSSYFKTLQTRYTKNSKRAKHNWEKSYSKKATRFLRNKQRQQWEVEESVILLDE